MRQTSDNASCLRSGDLVRVKSPEAILGTLDQDCSLDKMPFMPEMLDVCGKTFRVVSRADKTCDTATKTGGRRLTGTVHLEGQRCDGSAHGGCQARCLNFWKEAWLEPTPATDAGRDTPADIRDQAERVRPMLLRSTVLPTYSDDIDEPVYSCQATRLPEFTRPLSPWDLRQYWRDVTTNGVGIGRVFRVAFLSLYAALVSTGVAYRLWVALYDSIQRARGKQPWPFTTGQLTSTPSATLGLKVGELVRVRDFRDILTTLDKTGRNRGMRFDAEMVRFCGKTLRVQSRVDRIINESSGRMIELKNSCIILEGSWCSSDWSQCRRFCPRSIYHYWREIWLERVFEREQRQ